MPRFSRHVGLGCGLRLSVGLLGYPRAVNPGAGQSFLRHRPYRRPSNVSPQFDGLAVTEPDASNKRLSTTSITLSGSTLNHHSRFVLKMVRLVFRPYTQVRKAICTSAHLRASTRVSPGFALLRHSSPSFGSQQACSYSNLSQKIMVG